MVFLGADNLDVLGTLLLKERRKKGQLCSRDLLRCIRCLRTWRVQLFKNCDFGEVLANVKKFVTRTEGAFVPETG